jgi:pSer/pThr/pTyr-binding forkhead associated (FHA) protein
MAVTIDIESGGNSPRSLKLTQDEITIGRSTSADVILHADDHVCASQIHARLLRKNADWELQVEHRNGVGVRFRDGRRGFFGPTQRALLADGVELTIGRSGPKLRFHANGCAPRPSPAREMAVRILSGFNSPWSGAFSKDVVTIGRSADADVQLDPHRDTAVATGVHARLIRHDPGWFLEVEHRSGVTVSGLDNAKLKLGAGQRVALHHDCTITLGRNGPLLRLSPPSASGADIPVTCVSDDSMERQTMVAGIPTDLLEGFGTRHVRTRMNRFAAVGGLAVLILSVSAWRIASAGRAGPFGATLKHTKNSVYLLGAKRQDNVFLPCGTGWSAGDRILATNCHVVDALRGYEDQGCTLYARLPGTDPVDFEIAGMTTHPGWDRFRALRDSQFRSKSGAVTRMLLAFDVALVRTRDDIGPALPLASAQDIEDLSGGQEIAYVGFPMENLEGFQGNQPPSIATGTVTALQDPLGQSAPTDMSIIIQHDLPTLGGSSGSPIFDAAGHVIAINNAGHYIFVGGQRIPTGLRLGQRIDLLRDLIDGRAESRLDLFEDYFRRQFRAAVADPAEIPYGSMLAMCGQWIRDGVIPENNPADLAFLKRVDRLESGHDVTYTVNVRRNSRYVFAAASTDLSSISFEVTQNNVSQGADHGICARIAFQATATGPVTIRVSLQAGDAGRPRVSVLGAELPLVPGFTGR